MPQPRRPARRSQGFSRLRDLGRACHSGREIVGMLGVGRRHARPRERSSGHGGGSGGRWLVSYADFVTLMFGFFLILWASANQDPVKFSELALAFRRAFNTGAMVGLNGTGEIVGKGGRMGEIVISPVMRISE